jgi:cyclase
MEVLEAEPGAKFFAEQMIPTRFPEGANKIHPESFPNARFLRHEMMKLSTHAGSHVDAPGHYGGPLSPASFIDAVPARAFIAPGLCFDATELTGNTVHWDDLVRIAERHGIDAMAGHIVLIRIGPDKAVGTDIVEALLDRGVQIIGTDHESLDGPFMRMLRAYLQSNDSRILWPCHMLGRERPYYHYENLSNLHKLPPKDFIIWGPPIVVGGATAAWARVLALVPQRRSADA